MLGRYVAVRSSAIVKSHGRFSASGYLLVRLICASCGNRMKYAENLQPGYPIASGVVEGACRHLVEERTEQTGMRWGFGRGLFDAASTYSVLKRLLGITVC